MSPMMTHYSECFRSSHSRQAQVGSHTHAHTHTHTHTHTQTHMQTDLSVFLVLHSHPAVADQRVHVLKNCHTEALYFCVCVCVCVCVRVCMSVCVCVCVCDCV